MNEKQTCRVAVTLYLGRDLQVEEEETVVVLDRERYKIGFLQDRIFERGI